MFKEIDIGAKIVVLDFHFFRIVGFPISRYLYKSGGLYSGVGVARYQSNRVLH